MASIAFAEEFARQGSLPRTLLHIALNFIVLFGAYAGLQIATGMLAHRVPAAEHAAVAMAGFAVLSVAMLAIYIALVRVSERRRPSELAFAPRLGLSGAVLGVALFCSVCGTLLALGDARFLGLSAGAAPLLALIVAIGAGVGEELIFRGGVFRLVEDRFGTAIALAVSASLFGLMHAFNPGATAISTAAIALEAGVLLALAYAAARNLWFAIGLHAGWNFTEGGVFGTAVSGHPAHGLFSVSLSGPQMLTGGAFGPEASLVAVAISLAASLVLLAVTVRSGRWKPRRAKTVSATAGIG